MRGQDPPEVWKATSAQEIRRQKHEKENDNRSLNNEYGPGGRQRQLCGRKSGFLHRYRRIRTDDDCCTALRCADEALCKGQIDFETLCKAQNPGNTQNKNDKDNKEDQDDSSKNEQVSAGQSSMTSQVVNLVNSERAAQGLTALQKDSRLAALAQQKAEDMAKNQYFSHTSPTYGSAFDMLKAAGYSYKTAGENIAMGQKSAASVMDGWMHSSGHRANILHTSYEKIGVGYAVSADGMPYWVQIFAG